MDCQFPMTSSQSVSYSGSIYQYAKAHTLRLAVEGCKEGGRRRHFLQKGKSNFTFVEHLRGINIMLNNLGGRIGRRKRFRWTGDGLNDGCSWCVVFCGECSWTWTKNISSRDDYVPCQARQSAIRRRRKAHLQQTANLVQFKFVVKFIVRGVIFRQSIWMKCFSD